MAMQEIKNLKNLDAHSTVILNDSEKSELRKLGLNFTQDAVFGDDSEY